MKLLIITLIISMLSVPAVSLANDSVNISTSVPSAYTVTVNSTEGGRIYVSDIGYTDKKQFRVERFSSFSVTAVPDGEYVVGKITADRLEKQKLTKYSISFSEVCSDITIDITFVRAGEPPSIVSASEDCVLNSGGDCKLSVTAESPYALTYTWEVSADGGNVWSRAPQDNGEPDYYVSNAVPNAAGPSAPYIYRVTAEDIYGRTANRTIRLLVSDSYEYKKLADEGKKIYASAYVHDNAQLVLIRIDENSKDGTDIKSFLSKDTLPLMMYDVTLMGSTGNASPYFGDITLNFDVGSAYNGQTLRILHFHDNGTVDYHTNTVSNGIMQITVDSLSTFVVEIHNELVHKIQVSATNGGWVSVDGMEYAAANSDVTFSIIPDSGYLIDSVTVNGKKYKPDGFQLTIPGITEDLMVDVKFARNQLHLHGVVAVPLIIVVGMCMMGYMILERLKLIIRP